MEYPTYKFQHSLVCSDKALGPTNIMGMEGKKRILQEMHVVPKQGDKSADLKMTMPEEHLTKKKRR